LKKEKLMPPLTLTKPLTTSLITTPVVSAQPINQVVGTATLTSILNILRNPGLFGTIGIPPIQLPPLPTPAPTPQPASTPLALQILLAAIPIANDGDVITSEYHNTLRSALLALAQAVGAGLASTATATTIAPVFVLPKLPNDTHVGWDVSATGAKQPATNPNNSPVFGWMPIQLPNGEALQGMTVYGNKRSAVTDLTITLSRYSLKDTNQTPTPLITVSAKDGSGAIAASNVVTLPLVTSAVSLLDDLKLIDNNTYKYLITASLTLPTGGDSPVVELTAIQVTCGFA
jgi:hypothetical protein